MPQNPPASESGRLKGLGVEIPLNAAADSLRPKTTTSPGVEPNPDHKLERKSERKRDPILDTTDQRKLTPPMDHLCATALDHPGTLRRAAGAFKRAVTGERSRRRSTPVNGLSLHDDRVTGPYRERELMAHEHHMSSRRPQPATDIASSDARHLADDSGADTPDSDAPGARAPDAGTPGAGSPDAGSPDAGSSGAGSSDAAPNGS